MHDRPHTKAYMNFQFDTIKSHFDTLKCGTSKNGGWDESEPTGRGHCLPIISCDIIASPTIVKKARC